MSPLQKAVIFQLKCTIKNSKPQIWRRLLVRSDTTFEVLHLILQDAFGWVDAHLHEFCVGDVRLAAPNADDDFDFFEPALSENVRLNKYMGDTKETKTLYTYDFGDNWEVVLVIEKVLSPVPGQVYPWCVAGKRRGPLEDSGGIWGYMDMLQKLADLTHPEHDELLEWATGGTAYDPEAFDKTELNEIFTNALK